MIGQDAIGLLLLFGLGLVYGQELDFIKFPPVYWDIEEDTAAGTVLDAGIDCVDSTGTTMDIQLFNSDIITIVKFSLYNGGPVQYFLKLTAQLDYEDKEANQNRRRLRFTCSHPNANIKPIDYEVFVVVVDNNDNAPTFVRDGAQGQFYSTSVNENTQKGVDLIVDIFVRDIDGSENNRIEALCVPPTNPDDPNTCEMFGISATKSAGSIDYRLTITTLQNGYKIPASSTYHMVIKARDIPDLPHKEPVNKSPTQNVVIRVIDLQNLPPAILLESLSFSIYENVEVGFTLPDISAYDQDEGDPNNIIFVLEPNDEREGYDGQYFILSSTVYDDITSDKKLWKAHLILNRTVDRDTLLSPSKTLLYNIVAVEYPPSSDMDIVARNPMNTTKTVEIKILDINDETPEFNNDFYEITISERATITYEYRQISNDIIIQVTDKDGDQYNDFEVSIVNGDPFNVFSLDQTTGKSVQNFLLLVNDTVLDYEIPENRNHQLQLLAFDLNDPTKASRAIVTVRVTPQNDNQPLFNVSEYNFHVKEDEKPGYRIGSVIATDADSGDIITYSFQDLDVTKFAINSNTGEITLMQPVDFESQNAYVLIVRATDNGDPQKFRQINIQIVVDDTQDLGPQFQRTYSASLNEESKDLIPSVQVQAVDQEDMYPIVYSITNVEPVTLMNAFSIGSSTGVLGVTRFIDFIHTNDGSILVTVEARAGVLNASLDIPITVVDLNNFPPKFIPIAADRTYRIQIGENRQLGDTVFTMNATDDDGEGPNGQVRFNLGQGSKDDFIIAPDSGYVMVNGKLDIDEYSTYNITVQAQDNGKPMKTSVAFLIVTLVDENNKPPYFKPVVYTFSVREDVDTGFNIGQVLAFDPDSDHKIEYSLNLQSFSVEMDGNPIIDNRAYQAAQAALEVDLDTGWIRTRSALSRKLYHQVKLEVTAEDVNITTQARQIAEASVAIIVLSSSDNKIYFNEESWTPDNIVITKDRPEISSDTAINNMQIVGLVATDPLGSTISNFQEIDGYDVDDYFEVKRRVIYVKKALDYEALPANDKSVKVGVRAYSGDGNRTADIVYRFRIMDINDNLPQFDRIVYTFADVSESLLFPTKVGVVSAKDADSGGYGEVRFYLDGDGADDFDLIVKQSQQGRNQATLIVKKPLDYENRPTYSLTLMARDNPASSQHNQQLQNTISLVIRLKDENNKVPQFKDSDYNFNVVGTSPVGQEVGIVLATDADSGLNGQVHYTITDSNNNGSSLFRITTVPQGRTRVGRITVRNILESVPDRRQVRLNVTARDSGLSRTHSNTTIVIITVNKGVRDMKPKWLEILKETIFVLEHTAIGTEVMTMIARPYDNSSSIHYRFIESGDPEVSGKFLIDRNTGLITVGADINWEDKSRYTLLILATDSQNSSLTNQFLLHIIITDIDDNTPMFSACKDLRYSRPEIASVPEDEPAGKWVFTAKACDKDSTPFNQIRYEFYFDEELDNSICNSDVQSDFHLNSKTGVIQTTRPLDREIKSEYLLCVEAFPQPFSNSRRKRGVIDDVKSKTNHDTVLYILVQVSDMNDNSPRFPKRTMQTVILEYPKTFVSTAEAFDADLAPNNAIRYSLKSIIFHIGGKQYSAPTAFNINSNDGSITVQSSDFNDYVGGYFKIEVRAEDYFGNNNLSDIQIHTIYVTNHVNQIRVVFNKAAGPEVEQAANDMISELNELEVGVYYEIEKISYHVVTKDRESRYDRTDVCMVVVQDETVLAALSAATRLTGVAKVRQVLNKYGAVDPGPCEPAKSTYPVGWKSYWWVLIAFAVFIFVITCLLIILSVVLYKRHKQYMETQKTYLVPGRM